MDPTSFADVMGFIDTPPRADARDVAVSASIDDIRLPLAAARAGLKRRRWLAPGLWAAQVKTQRTDGWRAFLLRVPAGTALPNHRHRGEELIAVLTGAFIDRERTEAGDFVETGAASPHGRKVTDDGPCVCLVAMQGRVEWRGLARLITTVLGI